MDALTEIRKTVLEGLRGIEAKVYLYDSWTRGEAGRGSDIDVAMLPRQDLPSHVLSRLRETLEESTIPYVVELVDLSRADEVLRRRVLSEGVRWTEPVNA
jgi:predicted nucleotidyltransferase